MSDAYLEELEALLINHPRLAADGETEGPQRLELRQQLNEETPAYKGPDDYGAFLQRRCQALEKKLETLRQNLQSSECACQSEEYLQKACQYAELTGRIQENRRLIEGEK